MSLKEQISSQLDQLSDSELVKVSQYIAELKEQLPLPRVKNSAYLKVRNALKEVNEPSLSQLIIDERDDRI